MDYGVAPDGVIFATLMHAYFKAGNVEAAMNENGLCKNGRLDEAKLHFSKENANEISYTVLIDGLCKQENLVQEFRLQKQMVKEGIPPNLFAYSSLIFGLTNKGFMIEAKQVFDDMLKKGTSRDHVVYDILIR
ncbi:small ribosomal subunit protein mL103 (rPPR7)-like [Coffea arabica]|uniref:Small ribosomal subunit protein mL103 (RPPR7)-like n=1 Tax=Coffea arabica TaxID=13443 RepID=A0ABM4W8X8_COFAR